MNPTELHNLFSSKKQKILVATEPARLAELSEDELGDLLKLVRRARNKYTKNYRRQSAALVEANASRAGTATSNQRTKRKAEIFEEALARVARSLAAAARASAAELKRERIEAARSAKRAPRTKAPRAATAATAVVDERAATRSATRGGGSTKARRASSVAQGARRQARSDSR